MEFSNAIAITGGIGSGKSTACSMLKLYGYSIIDMDSISHAMLDLSKDEVVAIFGDSIVENNKINRKKLGGIVFKDKAKLEMLENILHPKIRKEVQSEAHRLESSLNGKPYFIDIPIFFELRAKGRGYDIAKVLLIYTPRDTQIQRIMKRDNLSYNEAINRLNNQIDIEEKRALSTYIIENMGDIKALQKNIEKFLASL